MNQDQLKEQAARHALKFVKKDMILGIGSGSTVNIFINLLKTLPFPVKGAVAASTASKALLKQQGIPCHSANDVDYIDVYIDGADEVTLHGEMIKGGGAALTREKILADLSRTFVCIVDKSKVVPYLGHAYPLPVEVIPMARSQVARKLVALGGRPEYRRGVVTDNNCSILDVKNFSITDPYTMEETLNNIPGIVTNGIFARNKAHYLIIASEEGVTEHNLRQG